MGKRTPLYEIHRAYDGHMVEFGGWEMPLYYSGIIDEHETVRRDVGLFDISHMVEIEVKGRDAVANLDRLFVSDVQRLSIFQVKYSALCYPEGGVVDDITLYRLSEDRFLLCTNASNTVKNYQWILQNLEGEAEAIDRSSEFAQLAIQGPKSFEVLQKLTPVNLSQIKYYWFVEGIVDGVQAIISRTGYTGEDGFELYFRPEYTIQIWEDLMAEGKCFGIKPIGLGARDTLRLEMAFPLYGHELDSMTTPLEAGLERIVDFRKGIFIGKEVLLKQKAEGLQRKLVGFRMAGEGIPRARYEIYKNDKKVGAVTSGTMSPTLRNGIGMGYVKIEEAWEGNEISIMIRQKKFPAKIVKTPFYKRAFTQVHDMSGGTYGTVCQTSRSD
jgi:aminomethyltransferase